VTLSSVVEAGAEHARRTAPRAKRLRIVFCIDGMGLGGTELNAYRTAERLDRSRYDISILCLQEHGPLLSRYREQGIPVLSLPLRRLHSLTALRQGVRFARYLSDERVDIVHSHDAYNNIFATACARMARVPVVIASRRWLEDLRRKSIGVVNRYAYRIAHCVVANSPRVADVVVSEDGVPADRVAVIPNFVDETAFRSPSREEQRQRLRQLGIPPEACVIGCVAGLRPVKDHETLIRAMAHLRPRWSAVRLVLIGDGDVRPHLERLVTDLDLGDVVRFAGAMPNEPNLHHLFDISVLSSVTEAFPNTIVEAMAAGKPVVATRVGGVADAVIEGETGTLVPPRSPREMANAIEELLLRPELRRRMGEAAQQRARTRYHAASVLPALEALYDRLLAANT